MGPDVHFRRTYALALEAGFGLDDAELVALADVGFDERYPARRSLVNITRHFAPWAWLWSEYYLHRAMRDRDLVALGWSLHTAQDAIAHGFLGEKHILLRLGLGRDPDVWEGAPSGVRRRIEATTRARLRRWAASG